MVQGILEARLLHSYGTRENWSTVTVQGKLEARLWYKGNLKHGYGTRETWSTVMVQGKLEARLGTGETWNTVSARLQHKGHLKQG